MEGYLTFIFWGTLVISMVGGHEDITPLDSRMDNLEGEIIDVRNYASRIENRVLNKVDVAKVTLKAELKRHMKQIMKEALLEVFQGESMEEVVGNQVVVEIKQLKRGHHQMKRQLHHVMRSLRDVQEDRGGNNERFQKSESVVELQTCRRHITDMVSLEKAWEKCNANVIHKESTILELEEKVKSLNSVDKLNGAVTQISGITVENQHLTSSQESTSRIPMSPTTVVSTVKPEEDRTRIIVAPFRSSTQQRFSQVKLFSNVIQSFPDHGYTYISALAYISKERKLLIAFESPDKIISSELEEYHVSTIRIGVECWGIAVDEEQQTVFLSLWVPRYSISRMNTDGTNHNELSNLSGYGSWPRGIAVHPQEKKIYACNENKVFMMSYDGRMLQILATGKNMNAVAMFMTKNILYYNDGTKLMQKILPGNITTEVTTLNSVPWNYILYKNVIYYSSYSTSSTNSGFLGAVDIEYNIVQRKLQTVNMMDIRGLYICLIP